jgi:hypothetical protein
MAYKELRLAILAASLQGLAKLQSLLPDKGLAVFLDNVNPEESSVSITRVSNSLTVPGPVFPAPPSRQSGPVGPPFQAEAAKSRR